MRQGTSWRVSGNCLLADCANRQEILLTNKLSLPFPVPPASDKALSELTLAHRRLSSKLDYIASEYELSQKLVLEKESEASIWRKERDTMAVLVQEWKDRVIRSEKEKEKERVCRIGAEEELRIVKLALEESQAGGSASMGAHAQHEAELTDEPPMTAQQPTESTAAAQIERISYVPNLCTSCSAIVAAEIPSSSAITLPSTPSNILLGVKGLHRLLADFQSALGASQEKVALLGTLADELEASKSAAMQEAEEARSRLAKIQGELEMMKAEDHGAGKVVERYM
jgi:hypothetical protein